MQLSLAFVLANYLTLIISLFSCWGWGRIGLKLIRTESGPQKEILSKGLLESLALALGVGFAAVSFQALLIAGIFQRNNVLLIISVGLVFATLEFFRDSRRLNNLVIHQYLWTPAHRLALGLVFIIGIPTLFAPLRPPIAWDEIMYHLPHAKQWADSGSLTINYWLRYPWFPYNFDLLFSASFLFDDDIFPHLIHASAGWMVAWLIYEIGALYANRVVAGLAAAAWLYLTIDQYGQADVDMGVTLWLLAGCVAFWRGWESRLCGWWVLSAFFIGLAAGSKYQALGILPMLTIAFAWRERRLKIWLLTGIVFAIPCAYWYVRNAFLAGDPVAPMGGRIFGFTDWNIEDYRTQFEDLRIHAGFPNPILWTAPFVFISAAARHNRALVAAGILALSQFLIWAMTSRYPRYLMPAYPFLLLLTAQGWYTVSLLIKERWPTAWIWPRFQSIALVLFGLLLCATSVTFSYKNIQLIAITPERREAILLNRISGYRVISYLRENPVKKLYQFSMEDAIYYLPSPTWGEVFGPWRYKDYNLAPAVLRKKLLDQDFDALVVHTLRIPSLASSQDFDRHFELLTSDGVVALYRIRSNIQQ